MISQTQINEEFVAAAIKDGRLTLSILMKLLGSSPIQLQCVQLKFINNKSYQEIAQIRKCFSAAARLNVKYGMDKIIKYLEDEANKGISLFGSKHPRGAAVDEDADISEDALETVELELTEANLEKVIKNIMEGRIK